MSEFITEGQLPPELNGAKAARNLDDGRVLVVYSMIYNDRICVGAQGDWGYTRAFCFPKDGSVMIALAEWEGDGDPPGPWIKETGTTRYRGDDAVT